jgi:DNA topoisomerase 6 subunit A-like protein
LAVRGCGLDRGVSGPKTADYDITLGIISPHIDLATDGKEPALAPFSEAIAMVLRKACNAAHRAMGKPPGSMSIKDAAWQVMVEAYRIASTSGTLPANARQIMYAARPHILAFTGKTTLDDHYFTQTLLPDYVEEHPEITDNWDVVFDDRGSFVEPHTGRFVPLGTVEVRRYLGERPALETRATIDNGSLSPTKGPANRYLKILFIEKEGFSALLARALLAERFDIAIMSTKGMSVTAARMLLDRLASQIDSVLVVHDFDVSGFSIFGTLARSSRRYRFDNKVRIIDLGLRLKDVEAMGLQSEPVEIKGDWSKRAATLVNHGASSDEIAFLRHSRVELNAMPSEVFVRFLERKLTEHGVCKVVPADDNALKQHARRVIARALITRVVNKIHSQVGEEAEVVALPVDLRDQVLAALERQPEIPWDLAVADIARKALDGACVP